MDEAGFGDGHLLFGFPVVKACEQLTGFYRVSLIHQNFCHAFLNARTDGGFETCLQCARAHDFATHFTRCNGVGDHRQRTELETIDPNGDDNDDNQPWQELAEGNAFPSWLRGRSRIAISSDGLEGSVVVVILLDYWWGGNSCPQRRSLVLRPVRADIDPLLQHHDFAGRQEMIRCGFHHSHFPGDDGHERLLAESPGTIRGAPSDFTKKLSR